MKLTTRICAHCNTEFKTKNKGHTLCSLCADWRIKRPSETDSNGRVLPKPTLEELDHWS